MKVMKEKQVCVLMVAALTMVVVLVGTTVAADSAPNYNCSNMTCGDKEIPYPFAIDLNNSSSKCFMAGRYILLICKESKIYTVDNLPVLNINISKAEMDVLFDVSEYCSVDKYTKPTLTSQSYVISSKENKFVTVGYDSFGYFNSYRHENKYSTGCLTRSSGDQRSIDNGTCSGLGCCQVDIPPKMWNISIEASNFNQSSEFCSYSFLVRNDNYTFSSAHLKNGLPFKQLPVVLDWTILDDNCSAATSKNYGDFNYYGCKKNSYCDDKDTDIGYRCHCNPGFEGNPYEPNGCTGQFFNLNFCKKSF